MFVVSRFCSRSNIVPYVVNISVPHHVCVKPIISFQIGTYMLANLLNNWNLSLSLDISFTG